MGSIIEEVTTTSQRKPRFKKRSRGKLYYERPNFAITGNTKVLVMERGREVVKPINKCLPPATWLKRASKKIQQIDGRIRSPETVAASSWWKLGPNTKLFIMRQEGKFISFA